MTYHLQRKRHVRVTQEQIRQHLEAQGSATEAQICEHFDISSTAARSKLDGLVHQGILIYDDYSAEGFPLTREHWSYLINELDAAAAE